MNIICIFFTLLEIRWLVFLISFLPLNELLNKQINLISVTQLTRYIKFMEIGFISKNKETWSLIKHWIKK